MAAPGVSSSAGRASGTPSGSSNDASYSMGSVSASLPGGGLVPSIQLRTKSPLPFFTCPHPIPPASATIGTTLKLSVLRLLTGEVSLKSSTAPMTESENLKLMTIHGWRSEMIALELRQNVLIAPETRNRIGEGIDDEMEGFELADDSDCGLLESGDEVLIRIKPAFALPDLHLPKLPKDHTYSLPPGALTRAGTLSAPPSYSQANIKRAAEPSSHSSSVQAQPNANYHARQYRDYSKGYRVVTVGGPQGGSSNGGQNNFGMSAAEIRRAKASSNPATSGPSRPLGLGAGVEPPAAIPAAAQYRPADIKTKRSSSYNKKDSQQIGSARALLSPLLPASTTASPAPTSPANIPSPSLTPASSQNPGRRPSAQRASTGGSYSYFNQDTKGAGNTSSAATSSNAMQQVFGSGGPAGQEAMPSSALVIGPGVQGSIGKGSSSAVGQSGNTTGDSGHSPMASIAEHGNAKAFTGFTAASGEVKARGKQRTASHGSFSENGRSEVRRTTTRNKSYEILSRGNAVGGSGEQPVDPARAAVEAAERRAAAARAALNESLASNGHNGNTSKTNGSSHTAKTVEQRELPARRDLPPIAHVSPFPPTSAAEEAEEVPSRSYFTQGATGTRSPSTAAAATPPYSPKPVDASVNSRRTIGQSPGAAETEYAFVDAPLPPIPSDEADEMGSVPPLAQGPGVHTRPSHTRMVSAGGESAVSKGSKKEGRFSRLAAPGLGFGARRQSSKNSVPKAEGYEGGTPTGEKEATRAEPASILAPRLGLGPRKLSSKKSITKGETQDAGGNGEKDYGATQPIAEDEPPSPSTPAFVDAETGEPENYFDAGGKKLSRAERRYQDFQKSYQAELTRQEQADRHRLSEREARRVESEKEQRKKEEEARVRREKEKWQIWEEVRKRA